MTLPAGYEITPARPGEAAALLEIEKRAGSLFPPEDLPQTGLDEQQTRDVLDRGCREGRVWVARELSSDAPVGFALASFVDGAAHLAELDVLPERGRRGLGRVLVEHVVAWARSQGSPSLSLTTFRHLPWNAPFYVRLGFRELGDADLGPQLRAVLQAEIDAGFDASKRVAMRLALTRSREPG